jgi:hypothetical protein
VSTDRSGGVFDLVAAYDPAASVDNQTSHGNLLREKENPDGTLPPG